MAESHEEQVVYKVKLDFSDAEKQAADFEKKHGGAGAGGTGGGRGGSRGGGASGTPGGNAASIGNAAKFFQQLLGGRGGNLGTSANSIIGQMIRGFGIGGNGPFGNFARYFMANVVGPASRLAQPGVAARLMASGGRFLGGAGGGNLFGRMLGGAALRGVGGAIAGPGGAALAGGGPMGLAALGIIASAKNIAKSLGDVGNAFKAFGRSLITGDASQALHGLVSYTQGVARLIGGPILGDILAKIIDVGHKVIEFMDDMVSDLGKWNAQTASANAKYQMTQTISAIRLSREFEGVMTRWVTLKTDTLNLGTDLVVGLKKIIEFSMGGLTKLLGDAADAFHLAAVAIHRKLGGSEDAALRAQGLGLFFLTRTRTATDGLNLERIRTATNLSGLRRNFLNGLGTQPRLRGGGGASGGIINGDLLRGGGRFAQGLRDANAAVEAQNRMRDYYRRGGGAGGKLLDLGSAAMKNEAEERQALYEKTWGKKIANVGAAASQVPENPFKQKRANENMLGFGALDPKWTIENDIKIQLQNEDQVHSSVMQLREWIEQGMDRVASETRLRLGMAGMAISGRGGY